MTLPCQSEQPSARVTKRCDTLNVTPPGLLIQIEREVWQDLDTGLYVSHCNPLDVCSQGDSEEEAVNNLNEAIHIFLSTCYEMGTLNEVLMECGLSKEIES